MNWKKRSTSYKDFFKDFFSKGENLFFIFLFLVVGFLLYTLIRVIFFKFNLTVLLLLIVIGLIILLWNFHAKINSEHEKRQRKIITAQEPIELTDLNDKLEWYRNKLELTQNELEKIEQNFASQGQQLRETIRQHEKREKQYQEKIAVLTLEIELMSKKYEELEEESQKEEEMRQQEVEQYKSEIKEEVVNEHREQITSLEEKYETSIKKVASQIEEVAEQKLKEIEEKVMHNFLKSLFEGDPKKDYSFSDIIDRVRDEEMLEQRKLKSEIREETDKLKNANNQIRDEVFGFKQELFGQFMQSEKRFLQVESDLDRFKTTIVSKFDEVQNSVKLEIYSLQLALQSAESSLTQRINETVLKFGQEVLRIDRNHMRLLEDMQKELLRRDEALMQLNLNVQENYLKLERQTENLVNENRRAIELMGLSVIQVKNEMEKESLRVDRQLLLAQKHVDQYAQKIAELSTEAQMLKLEAEKTNMKSEQHLERANIILEKSKLETERLQGNARLLLNQVALKGDQLDIAHKESIQKQKEALAIIHEKERDLYNSMQDLAVKEAGIQMLYDRKIEQFDIARKKLELAEKSQKQIQQSLEREMRMRDRLEDAENKLQLNNIEMQKLKQKHDAKINELQLKLGEANWDIDFFRRQKNEAEGEVQHWRQQYNNRTKYGG